MLAFKVIHVLSMVGVITLWVGGWIIWDLVARTGDRVALRRVDAVTQRTGPIGYGFLIVGVVAGFATALTGGFDLVAPWLLIAYAILAADILFLRWAAVHVSAVRGAQESPATDLQAVARSTRGNLTLAVLIGSWAFLVFDMVAKPFS